MVRGGEEQRRLKRSQFKRSYDPDCYTSVENGSKNRAGVNFREENKDVPVFSCPEAKPRCLVYLYFEKFPPKATELKKSPSNDLWYDREVMYHEAGITEKKKPTAFALQAQRHSLMLGYREKLYGM